MVTSHKTNQVLSLTTVKENIWMVSYDLFTISNKQTVQGLEDSMVGSLVF